MTIVQMDAAGRALGDRIPGFTGMFTRLRPAPVGYAEGRALRTP